jgi:hypothetical protein
MPSFVGLPAGTPSFIGRGVEPLPGYPRDMARVNAVIVGGHPPAAAHSRRAGRRWSRTVAACHLPVRRR